MSVELLTVVAFLPGAACGALVVGGFVLAWRHDAGRPTTPDWGPAELSALVLPTGEHQIIRARAFEQIAEDTGHIARHDWEETPPSMRRALWWMTAAERGRALTAELGNYRWRPARPYRTGVAW